MSNAVTIERIERAKQTVARQMVNHNMPDLIATISFLDAELAKLREATAAMEHAKEILRNGRNKGSNTRQAA